MIDLLANVPRVTLFAFVGFAMGLGFAYFVRLGVPEAPVVFQALIVAGCLLAGVAVGAVWTKKRT